jgi:hypothetical protein
MKPLRSYEGGNSHFWLLKVKTDLSLSGTPPASVLAAIDRLYC